jgi:hypothetical protein
MNKLLMIGASLCCVLILSAATMHAQGMLDSQCGASQGSTQFGFSIGVQHSNILHAPDDPDVATVDNNLGLRLGILADVPVGNWMAFVPKAELSFNNGSVLLTGNDGNVNPYDIMVIAVELAPHVVFRPKGKRTTPYFLLGPNVRIPFHGDFSSTSFQTSGDVALDLGIGLEQLFRRLSLAPELRYSVGFMNINQQLQLQSVRFHNVALVLQFKG